MPTSLTKNSSSRRAGDSPVHAAGLDLGATLLDFWRWWASDLGGNALRGVLAEFLVGHALRVVGDRCRTEWEGWGFETPAGIKAEVKASGYVQSWPQRELSRPSFDIAAKRAWTAATNSMAVISARSADVYVFALHAPHLS